MKKIKNLLLILMVAVLMVGCNPVNYPPNPEVEETIGNVSDELKESANQFFDSATEDLKENANQIIGSIGNQLKENADEVIKEVGENAEDIASNAIASLLNKGTLKAANYSGLPYTIVNENVPYFTDIEKQNKVPFEIYSPLDSLGRCGVAYANICKEIMPTEDRGDISSVKPTGWVNNQYDNVDGGWLYNRSHIIGFQLSGENANEKNLITGTRYMNVEGMLPFENMIDDYVDESGNHVLYRVTPIFVGNNLVCEGVLMEAWSVEDNGEGICFNVFCYNVQPGITIDYETGNNYMK